MKPCSKCGLEKELSDFFKQKAAKDGHRYDCKSCESKSNKKWSEENKDRISKVKKAYREANKKRIAEYNKKYYATHKERFLEYVEYYEASKKELAELKKRCLEDNSCNDLVQKSHAIVSDLLHSKALKPLADKGCVSQISTDRIPRRKAKAAPIGQLSLF